MDQESVNEILKSDDPVINLSGSSLTIPILELIVKVIEIKGRVRVVNACGSISLLEIGAYLAEVSKNATLS